MAFDNKCYELAAAFLADDLELASAANRDELAQIIQDTIEDYLQHKRGES